MFRAIGELGRTAHRYASARSAGEWKFQTWVGAFLQGLPVSGWTIGRNLRVDTRWAGPMPTTFAGTRRNWPRSRPTSFWPWHLDRGAVAAGDPHRADRVRDRRRPGRRRFRRQLGAAGRQCHGFMVFEYSLSAKWLELLKEIAPGVKRVAVLRDPPRSGIGQFGAIQSAAPSLGMEAIPVNVRDAGEIDRDIAAFARSRTAA